MPVTCLNLAQILVCVLLLPFHEKKLKIMKFAQIPDIRTGDDIIDAVVVDEEAVGIDGKSLGAKILYGKDALSRYLSQNKSKNDEVRVVPSI